jgi:hypothetical protein
MRGARYEWTGYGGRTAHWPFSMPDVTPESPCIAPEFRSSLERILSTSRFYLRIEVAEGRRPVGTRRRARRR